MGEDIGVCIIAEVSSEAFLVEGRKDFFHTQGFREARESTPCTEA